jgi:hypothetical protein
VAFFEDKEVTRPKEGREYGIDLRCSLDKRELMMEGPRRGCSVGVQKVEAFGLSQAADKQLVHNTIDGGTHSAFRRSGWLRIPRDRWT